MFLLLVFKSFENRCFTESSFSVKLKKNSFFCIVMKLANKVKINVFVKPEEDEQKNSGSIKAAAAFDLEKEKIMRKKSTVQGFDERKIII